MRAYSAMRRFEPEILHVSSPSFLVFAGIVTSRLLNCPIVISYHTHLPVYAKNYYRTNSFFRAMGPAFAEWLSWRAIKACHCMADLTLVTSPQMKAEFEANGIERVAVWRKGIDTDRFHPRFKSEAMRARLTEGHPEAPLIVYVGRLAVEKRLKELRRCLEENPGCRLALVGTGPATEELRAHFEGLPVCFPGQLSGDALSEAFASADVFAMPSDSETLGFVVLEAMASGVPVVGCNAGGIPSIILDGTTGFLARRDDASSDLSAKVGALVQSPALREAMGKAARAEAEKWDWETATAHLRNVNYKTAVANHRQRRNPVASLGRYCVSRGAKWYEAFALTFVDAMPFAMV